MTSDLVNWLRGVGFRFVRQADRIDLYKNAEGREARLRRRDWHTLDEARAVLRMASATPDHDAIAAWIKAHSRE